MNNIEIKDSHIVAPGIAIIDSVIENPQRFIQLAQESDGWDDAGISSEGVIEKSVRNTRRLSNISPTPSNDVDASWLELARAIWKHADAYGNRFGIGFSSMEPTQLLHYEPSEGFYMPHFDSGPGMPRIFSAVLYLNDVEVGGETHFTNFNISVKPKAGRLALFPAEYTYEHEARPPVSGDKFAVVTWFTPVF